MEQGGQEDNAGNDSNDRIFQRQLPAQVEIRISPDDRGFLFADGLYEVVRAYGGKPLKTTEHLDRLARSLRETRIDFSGVADLAVAGT